MQGVRFGNYEIVSQLGAGGMGTVYVARHSLLGRTVAVKVLRPELSQNREIVTRFFNEARAATSIRHPGIIEVFDFGHDETNCAYIIMELLQGENLGQRLHHVGRVSLSQAITIVRQIAGALQAAHAQHILHRDLKPDNVFLVPDPEIPSGERIKLLDFGIAKLLADPSTQGRSHTETGAVMGTPTYMSPEQCRGSRSTTLDERSDLYALGCIFYELLSGRPPFLSDGVGDLLAHHMYFPPPPLRALLPDLPPSVESLVLRLLAKDPQERPACARAVITELDALGPAASPSPQDGALITPARRLGSASPTTLSGSTRPLASQRSARGTWSSWRRPGWILFAGGVPIVVAAAWLGLRTPEPAQGSRGSAVSPPAPLPPEQAPPKHSTPAAPPANSTVGSPVTPSRTVLLQFLVRPETVSYDLSIDGKKLSEPQVEVLMSRDRKIELEIFAKGYLPYRAKLLPTSDQILTIELQRDTSSHAPDSAAPRPGKRVERVERL